jgi:hypothetical protein
MVRVIGIINDLLTECFSDGSPDFMSVDIEGLDYEVIQNWDFDKWQPMQLCLETSTLTQ